MDDSERKKKQDYLKKEILDRGYDREEFAEFMLAQQDDGLNVDNWDYRELIMVVDEFISGHKPVANANNDIIYEEPKQNYNAPEQFDTHTEFEDDQFNYDDSYGGDTSLREEEYKGTDPNEEEKTFEERHRTSDKILQLKRQQESEKEKIRDSERDEERKLLKKQKKKEREERRRKRAEKKEKKAQREERLAEEKLKLEYELEDALKGDLLSKKFSDMVPKTHLEYKAKKDRIPGEKLNKTELTKTKDINIVVKNPELKDEGFFAGKHLCFKIETDPLGWVVERKDKDFNLLRDYLVKAFPHIMVPAVPEYHAAKTLDKNFLRKRESLLNRFMNKLMLQEDLKASPMVVDFLSFADYKQFSKQLKKDFDNFPKLRYLHEYPTLSGEHKINVTKKAEMFCNQLEKYYSSHEVLFKKFHFLGKKLSSDLMEVSKTLWALSLCSQHISVLYDLGNSRDLSDVYQKMREHFRKWGKDIHNEAKLNLKYLPQYFNYSSLENQAYKDMFNKRNKVLEKFVKKNNELLAKKEKLFKAGRADKWALSEENLQRSTDLLKDKIEAFKWMVPEETKVVNDYENTYLYLTSQCYNEIKKINREDVDDLKDHLQDYASRMSEALTESHLTWADFETAMQEESIEDSSATISQTTMKSTTSKT